MSCTLRPALMVALVVALCAQGCGHKDSGTSSPSPSPSPSASPGAAAPGTTAATTGVPPAPGATPPVHTPPKAPPKEPPVKRPPLMRHQGQYFAWAMPAGWNFNETANGVDVYAPDQKSGAGVSVVFNYPGRTTPPQLIDTCNGLIGITDPSTVSEKALPDAPGFAGIPWKLFERDYKYTYKGMKARRKATAGVQSYGNGFNAAVGYYACEATRWDEQSTWLIAIVNSIVVTNPRQLANLDKVTLPKNNPMDDSALKSYWKEKGLSEDRIFQGEREGMMGYEEMESKETGKVYQMPLETYDATKGGYHSPENFDEMLAKPGR